MAEVESMDFSFEIISKALHDLLEKQGRRKEMGDEKIKNFACSPLSITILLNMVIAGSKGYTLDEFLKLSGSKNLDEINDKSAKLQAIGSNSNNAAGGPELLMSNAVFVDQTICLKPAFNDVVTNIYNAYIKQVDFRHKGDEAADEVNSWVQKATKGLIKEATKKGQVNPNKLISLLNAIYFKGAWQRPFDVSRNRDGAFYLPNGKTTQVSYMCETCEYYDYCAFDGFQLLKLPYKNGDNNTTFSMYFFLPNEKHGLKTLLDHTNHSGFFNQTFDLRMMEINSIMIPQFELLSKFSVSKIMTKMGLILPCLNDMVMDGHDLNMEISHRAFIHVNEQGTEAAAVTCSDDLGCSLYSPPPIHFIVDHPFLFIILKDNSRIPFYVGAVLHPTL